MNLVFGIIVGFLVLTTLVVLHELGHFFMAKKNGVKVNEFGIGFPPRAIAWIHLPKDQVEDFIKNLPEEEQSKLPLAKIRQKLEKILNQIIFGYVFQNLNMKNRKNI